MAAFKRLIQLGSRLRVIHVGSTMKTPPLRRTSVNSYSWLSSSSSDYGSEYYRKQEQGPDLAFLRHEFTKLQNDIGKMREKLETMHMDLNFKRERAFRDMSDENNKLISEAKKKAIKYSILVTLLGPLTTLLFVSVATPVAVDTSIPALFLCLLLCIIASGNGGNGRNRVNDRDSRKD